MNVENIGIIGQGFVGTATCEGLRDHFDVYTYDKFLVIIVTFSIRFFFISDCHFCLSLQELVALDNWK